MAGDVRERKLAVDNMVHEIHEAIDTYVDTGEGREEVEELLSEGFDVYREAHEIFHLALGYQEMDERPWSDDRSLEETRHGRQPVEPLPLVESLKDYEDALLRYAAISNETRELDTLQDLLEDGPELPDGVDPEFFAHNADYIE